MQFVGEVQPNEDGSLQIMYGIDGRRDLTETTRDDLSGYAGARPVRVGNAEWAGRSQMGKHPHHEDDHGRRPAACWPPRPSCTASATSISNLDHEVLQPWNAVAGRSLTSTSSMKNRDCAPTPASKPYPALAP